MEFTNKNTMITPVKFTKMHGLGNDFMVIDATLDPFEFTTEQIKRWSDRHVGIGFDQLLVVELSGALGVDFCYRIFNADGSEVAQCGNGARCFASFVVDKGLTQKSEITVETASGVIVLYVIEPGLIKVNMGAPNFTPASLPMNCDDEKLIYSMGQGDELYSLGAVSVGNPHAVIPVTDIEHADVARIGAMMTCHAAFPERVNVGFAQKIDSQHIRLRVYERGAAETLACGTGACAAMAVFRHWGEVDSDVTVSLPGGDLRIQWSGELADPIWMTGPTQTVFDGVIEGALKDA